MNVTLNYNFLEKLKNLNPTFINKLKVDDNNVFSSNNITSQIIPPLNTIIDFKILPSITSDIMNSYQTSSLQIKENFNWRSSSELISKPGNQMLCGSCWAISTAGIINDNFIVSKMVDFNPNLSTTWCLACFPQLQCKGGNPAKLFKDISKGGIVSNHCVDYSWCANNEKCNGNSIAHFEEGEDISQYIPNCGCYFQGEDLHYIYYIDEPMTIYKDLNGMSDDIYTMTVKKHILEHGPVLGGFIVFDNFMSGNFTNINGGVYLESGVYGFDSISFDENYLSEPQNYIKGSHAVAIIGWGTEKNIIVDNYGTRKDVPYWYCRNSWTKNWGHDGGYFKMAMHPYNKISQFDKIVSINDNLNTYSSGGIVLITVSKNPEKVTLKQVDEKFLQNKRLQKDEYYKNEKYIQRPLNINNNLIKMFSKSLNFLKKNMLIIILLVIIFSLIIYLTKKLSLYSSLNSNKSKPKLKFYPETYSSLSNYYSFSRY